MLKWHEVTPLSRLLAIIVFVGLIPAIFFYLGMQYQDMKATESLMHTYEFPRLYSFSGADATSTLIGASSTIEIVR